MKTGGKVLDKKRNKQVLEFLKTMAADDPRVLAIKKNKFTSKSSVVMAQNDAALIVLLDKAKIVKPVHAVMFVQKMMNAPK